MNRLVGSLVFILSALCGATFTQPDFTGVIFSCRLAQTIIGAIVGGAFGFSLWYFETFVKETSNQTRTVKVVNGILNVLLLFASLNIMISGPATLATPSLGLFWSWVLFGGFWGLICVSIGRQLFTQK